MTSNPDAETGLTILAADTSSPILSVALARSDRLVAEAAFEGRNSRNQRLLPAIDWMLAESGTARGDIGLLVVTRGPGSFTGVRVGLATFQGLALALSCAICAFSTHEVALCAGLGPNILVFDDAGRGEFYASGYWEGQEKLSPCLVTQGRLEELRRDYKVSIDMRELTTRSNLAVLAAARAREIIGMGKADHYGETTPIYVRLAEAEVKRQQKNHA